MSCSSEKAERGKMQIDMDGKVDSIFMNSVLFPIFVEHLDVAEKYKMSRKLLPTCLYFSERKQMREYLSIM